MGTMTVEQGKCEIYPEKAEQMCVRVRVLVMQLKPNDNPQIAGEPHPEEWEEWIADGEPLDKVDLRCGNDGLTRLRKKIADGVKPPTPRPRKAGDVVNMPTIRKASNA